MDRDSSGFTFRAEDVTMRKKPAQGISLPSVYPLGRLACPCCLIRTLSGGEKGSRFRGARRPGPRNDDRGPVLRRIVKIA